MPQLAFFNETYRDARFNGTPHSTDAAHIHVGVRRRFVVEDGIDIFHLQSTGCNLSP